MFVNDALNAGYFFLRQIWGPFDVHGPHNVPRSIFKKDGDLYNIVRVVTASRGKVMPRSFSLFEACSYI